jgi:DNA-binding PadR family transcriptional regulator
MMRADAARVSGIAQGARELRPITSQFYWALLGLVIKRPGYGYELARRFEQDYGDVLPLHSDSHIYTGLKELEVRRLIEPATVVGWPSSRAAGELRPGYRATELGRQSYTSWLLTRIDDSRRDWMVFARLLASLATEPEVALEIIDRYRQTLLAQAPKTHMSREEREEPLDEASRLAWRLIDEERRSAAGRMLDWVDFAQREFEALAHKQA